MNSFLFNGLVSSWHKGQYIDSCVSSILYGADQPTAWNAFEHGLLKLGGDENSAPAKVEKIFVAPVSDQVLIETGNFPLDWEKILPEMQQILEGTDVEEMGQGYWVDCNQWPPPGQLSSTLESLPNDLPEDIRTGLNWSAEKSYYFLLSVLRPPALPPEFIDEPGPQAEALSGFDESDETVDEQLLQRLAAFPELWEKDLAVLIRARNSVVAAWLWRKQALGTPLAPNAIRIDACCEVLPVLG